MGIPRTCKLSFCPSPGRILIGELRHWNFQSVSIFILRGSVKITSLCSLFTARQVSYRDLCYPNFHAHTDRPTDWMLRFLDFRAHSSNYYTRLGRRRRRLAKLELSRPMYIQEEKDLLVKFSAGPFSFIHYCIFDVLAQHQFSPEIRIVNKLSLVKIR